jgi:hypothetical protein
VPTRRTLLTGAAVAALAAAGAGVVAVSGSDDPGAGTPPEAFTRGPYLTRVAVTDARLRWIAADPGATVTVRAAPDGGDGAEVEARDGRFSGLRPDTVYRWTALVDGAVRAEGRFTTAPRRLTGRLTFVVFGDYGNGSDEQRAVAARSVAQDPRVLVTTGDNSYLVALPGLLDRNIFQPLRDLMAVAPHYGVVGDHDVVFPEGRAALVESLEWPGDGERYVLDYGPVRFVALGLAAGADDVAFARRALAAPGPAARFVVVHQPPKRGNPILPVLAGADVTAVLSGHLHAYERRARPEVPGVPMFTVGTGGAPASEDFTPRSPDAQRFIGGFGLLRVDVAPDGVTYRYIDTEGRVGDRLSAPLDPGR